jgi:hypothetical protein
MYNIYTHTLCANKKLSRITNTDYLSCLMRRKKIDDLKIIIIFVLFCCIKEYTH